MNRNSENRFAYFCISNEIVIIELKEDIVINLQSAQAIATERLILQRDRFYSVLFDITSVAETDKEGRDYFARYGWFLTRRISILANGAKSQVIAKFYVLLNKPEVHTQIFTDRTAALYYLKDH